MEVLVECLERRAVSTWTGWEVVVAAAEEEEAIGIRAPVHKCLEVRPVSVLLDSIRIPEVQ
jgi:hypothetical protein